MSNLKDTFLNTPEQIIHNLIKKTPDQGSLLNDTDEIMSRIVIQDGKDQTTNAELAQYLYQLFPWIILNNKLAVFDKYQGLYTSDEKTFSHIILIAKPALSKQTVNAIIQTITAFATKATQQQHLMFYTGSQYLLFKNGVLDIKSMKLIKLNDKQVTQLYFTKRHLINTEWHSASYWSNQLQKTNIIDKFIDTYADNTLTKNYLLALLGMGLFAGHNFGINISIKGESGAGKTFLRTFFDGAFPHQVKKSEAQVLNKDFILNGVSNENTSVIWLDENNKDQQLDGQGTSRFDQLANDTITLPVKHEDDIEFYTSTVFVDGTQLVQAQDMTTGPARRIMPFIITNDTHKTQERMNIIMSDPNILTHSENVSYLSYLAITQYLTNIQITNPKDDLNNIKINPNLIISKLPLDVQLWRKEVVMANERITTFVEERIIPFLKLGEPVNPKVFFELYKQTIIDEGKTERDASKYAGNAKKFTQSFIVALTQRNYKTTPVNQQGRLKIKSRLQFPFQWVNYVNEYVIPNSAKSKNEPGMALKHESHPEWLSNTFYDKQTRGWFKIEK